MRGWTLTELVVVLAVLAVLGSLAAPRFFDRRTLDARGYALELADAARAARRLARATGCPVRMQVAARDYRALRGTALGRDCDPNATRFPALVVLPDGASLAGQRPTGVADVAAAEWTFAATGAVRVRGSAALSIGPHRIAIDPTTGIVSGP
jgi:MSHA pilin protein MshC